MTITLRQESDARASTKGSALTFQELDNNFIDMLNRQEITIEGDSGSAQLSADGSATDKRLVVNGSGGITTAVTSDSAGQLVLTVTQGASTVDFAEGVIAGTNIDVTNDSTGQVTVSLEPVVDDIELKDYKETVYALGSTDTPTITVSNGNVQSVTISAGLSLPAFSDAAAGQSVTLLVTGSGNATGTGAYKFSNTGAKTLTSYSVVSIFYDGTTYWTSIATDFQA